MPVPELIKLRENYPEYNDMDDLTLASKLVAKYPEYQDVLDKVKGKPEELRADPRKLSLSTQETAMEYIRPLMEAGGMALGGILGAPAEAIPIVGPAAHAVATGGGYALGKRGADVIGEKVFGIPSPKRTMGEEALSTAEDVTLGGITEGVGPAIAKVGKRIAAPFAKTMTPEAEATAKLAAERGVKLTPAEITQDRPLSLVENALGFVPGSAGIMQRQKVQQLQKLIDLRENLLAKVSEGRTTDPRSLEQVGLDIKVKLDELSMMAKGKVEAESGAIKENILKSLGSKETYESLGMSAQRTMAKRSQLVADEGEKLYNKVWDSLKEDIPTPNLRNRADALLRQEIAKPQSLQNKSVITILDDLSGGRLKSKFNLEDFSPGFKEQIEKQLSEVETRLSPRAIQGTRSELNNRIIASDLAFKTQQAGEQKMLSSSEGGIYKQLRKSLEQDLNEFFVASEKTPTQKLQSVVAIKDLKTGKVYTGPTHANIINDKGLNPGAGGEEWTSGYTVGGRFYKSERETLDALKASSRGEIKKDWDAAQVFWREGKQTFNKKAVLKAMQTTPDKVIDMVFAPGSTTAINQVRAAVGNTEFEKLSQGLTNRMFERASKGGFEWGKVSSELDRYGEQTLKTIYAPADLASLRKGVSAGVAKDKPIIDEYFKKILRHASPETVFNVIFKPNNSENVYAIKRVIPEEVFQDGKRVLTEKVLATNELGLYRPFKGVTQFSKFDEDTLRTIYKPEELKDLKELIQISKRSQGAERISGNPSGTAQSMITFFGGRAILRHPVTGMGYILPPNLLARMYLSDTARKYLTSGFRLPGSVPQASNIASKILAIAGNQAEPMEQQ